MTSDVKGEITATSLGVEGREQPSTMDYICGRLIQNFAYMVKTKAAKPLSHNDIRQSIFNHHPAFNVNIATLANDT
jgi:hypothetical protein